MSIKRMMLPVITLLAVLMMGACNGVEPKPDKVLDEGFDAAFDWRDQGMVSRVQSQDPLNSCAVFAVLAMAESAIARTTGELLDLSEQHFINVSPAWNNTTGVSPEAVLAFMQEQGVVLESELPYGVNQAGVEPQGEGRYKISGWGSEVVGGHAVAERRRMIKAAIRDRGPVISNLSIYRRFYDYSGGVYATSSTDQEVEGHWVAFVGWQDDDEVESGGYWICKNSWGAEWGEDGYWKVVYGDASGVDDYIIYWAEYEISIAPGESRLLPANPLGGYHPLWSPQDNRMIYTIWTNGGAELWMWDDDAQTHAAVMQSVKGDLTPSWSPDGTRVVFDGYVPGQNGLQLYTLDVMSGEVTLLTRFNYSAITPSWDHSGQRIAFGPGQIRILNLSDQSVTAVPNTSDAMMPDWSPDDEMLVYSGGPQDDKDIYLINRDGSSRRRLTEWEGREDRPQWSPDGRLVAYERFIGQRIDTWVVHVATGTHFEIRQDAGMPSWLPDGRLVVVTPAGFRLIVLEMSV